MKKIKSVVSLLLVVVLALSLTACGGSKPASEAASKAESAAASVSAEAASSAENTGEAGYTIGHTNLGAGVWILDMYQKNAQYVADELGMTLNPASANFSSDQMVKDLQNQISSGEQGHLYFGAISTLTPTASELFEKAGV